MSASLERAALLLQQSRPVDAERELVRVLSEHPDHAIAHAYLALSLAEQKRYPGALESARSAIAHAPDLSFTHYVLAQVLHRMDHDADALKACHEAIRLSPHDERNHALLSSIHLALRQWTEALTAAEAALAINPAHVPSANLRSMALIRLNRKDEAAHAIHYALQQEPNNALSHANQGWNELHRNNPRNAQVHFREALRLDPELEYARQGMLEALRARNPAYRVLLQYFLWMGRQSRRLQWALVLTTFFGIQFARSWADSNPTAGRFVWPVLIAFYLFVYLSWTSGPIFNLLLRLDPFGRLVLSRDERVATNWFGACLLGALGGIAWALFSDHGLGWVVAAVAAMLSIAVSLTFNRTGRSRLYFGLATAAEAVLGATAIVLLALNNPGAGDLLTTFFVGFIALQLASNVASR